MKMYLISDNVDTLTGMRLAGIDGVEVHTDGEIRSALDHVLEDKTIGILLLTEKLSREHPEYFLDLRMSQTRPLVIDVPDRHGTGRSPDFITDYVSQAIGLKL